MTSLEKKRPIRSFVRREGRITPRQQRAIDLLWPKYGLDHQPLDLVGVFGNQANVVFEIGFGMGQSLLQMAKEHPELNFVGVEVFRPGVGSLLAGIGEHGVENLRLLQGDAKDILRDCIADSSLSKVQIFFPDPWPKKRHHKRRLVQSEFLDLLAQKIKLGGQLHLATDWEHYAMHMMEVLSAHSQFKNAYAPGEYSCDTGLRPGTKFEQRGKRLGHGVWDLLFIR